MLKNNYNFNVLKSLTNIHDTKYNIIVVIYSNYDELIAYLNSLIVNTSEKIDKKYKGPKGTMYIIYINDVKYILVSSTENDNLIGIIGNNMLEKEERENKKILVIVHNIPDKIVSYNINDLLQGLYRYDELKTVASVNIEVDFHSPTISEENISKIIAESKIIYEIRDLVNKPVNILNSTTYHEHIQLNKSSNITMTVLNKKELMENNLNLILAVNKGSTEEPKMIILEYNPPNAINNDPIFLVGKGVMFDTGGINLKTGNFTDMKTDMVGSAIVYGVLKNLSLHNCNKRVVGLLLVVQNDIGPNAIHPGDVVTSHSGKTVEITDTDAEGRLILADGISYCETFCKKNNCKPSLIIDIGSLTGQLCQIFDDSATGYMTNDTTNYIKSVLEKEAAEENDYIWQLPLWPHFIKKTKSSVADYRNYSFNSADAILCGSFLYNFLPSPEIPWLHLDIAGISYSDKVSNDRCNGATGDMLKTISRFLMKINISTISK